MPRGCFVLYSGAKTCAAAASNYSFCQSIHASPEQPGTPSQPPVIEIDHQKWPSAQDCKLYNSSPHIICQLPRYQKYQLQSTLETVLITI